MSQWDTTGVRGTTLESLINTTNDYYREKHLAMIQKIPTPITPVSVDRTQNNRITLAYFNQKSTVDYIGAVQDLPVCFDAKECQTDTFPLSNVHRHQIAFMQDFSNQGGIAFLMIYFTTRRAFYYMPLRELEKFLSRAESGGRKSFRIEELDEHYFLKLKKGYLVPYLETIQQDLCDREQDKQSERGDHRS